MKRIAIISTVATLGNVVCGFGAITFAARIPRGTTHLDEPAINWLWYGSVMILTAVVFDLLGGCMVREAGPTIGFGRQLASLCSVVSFGVAPALLLLKLCGDGDPANAIWLKSLWIIATLYIASVALRLARLSVETNQSAENGQSLSGLPSPAAAGAIASAGILRHSLRRPAFEGIVGGLRIDPESVEHVLKMFVPVGAIALAVLMLSRVHYPRLTNQIRGKNLNQVLRTVLVIAIVVVARELALPIAFWTFAFASPLAGLRAAVAGGKPTK